MTKPREFWIEFGGDPSDDKEVYKRYSATIPFKPCGYSDEVVHGVEYSAYSRAIEALRRIETARGHADKIVCLITIGDCADFARATLKELGELK